MADENEIPAAGSEIPAATVRARSRWPTWLVWIVPAVALIFGGWLAMKTLNERGPTITITFKSGEGIEARKTKIRYRDVDLGEVKAISLSKDRANVIVTAQLTREASDLLADDTKFWVVRPRVSGGNVSGLSTLLSGAYIGMDPGQSQSRTRDFVGLEQPIVVTRDLPGRQYVLRGDDLGSLDVGSPVYFKHIQVGQVVAYELDANSKTVTVRVFVNAPYDRHVTANVRFYHSEGVDLKIDASGLKLDTQSIVSILLGGLAFDVLPDAPAASPAPRDAVFRLYADRASAVKPYDFGAQTYVIAFTDSVRNLAIGAPVDFKGVVIGEVQTVDIVWDPVNRVVTVPVTVRVNFERLRQHRARPGPPQRTLQEFLDRLVENRGFRAQLRTASLLTNQLYIALDFFPEAPAAKMVWNHDPPEFPSAPGSLQELQNTLTAIAKKLEKVPFEEIGTDLRTTLRNANRLITQLDQQTAPELKATLEDARRSLRSLEATAKSLETAVAPDAPLQQDLRGSLNEIARAAQSLRALSDYIERHPESLIRGKPKDAP
jgi:paraquat-inducible protein B